MAKVEKAKKEAKKSEKKVPTTQESKAKKTKKVKKTKLEKMVLAKKLPKLFKKSYTEKQFKKLLSHVQIPEDKEALEKLFVKEVPQKKNKAKKEFYVVHLDQKLPKSEISRFKILAKELDNYGSRVKWGSLVAVIVAVVAIVVCVTLFKNPIAKKIMISAMENIFEAKSEISKVDISLLKGQIKVEDLKIGNKDNVMTNIFEAQVIDVDFNLTQAFRGKFDAENLEVSGMAFGTERKTSCALTKTKKDSKKSEKTESKKAKETKKSDSENSSKNSSFMASLNQKKDASVDTVKEMATNLLGGTDVDSIVENLLSQFQSTQIADDATKTVENLVEKWKNTPNELKTQVDDFSSSVKSLQNINVKNLSDIASLQDALTKINNAMNTSKTVVENAQKITADIKTDSDTVKNLGANVSSAVKSDKDLVSTKLGGAVSAVQNSKQILTSAIDSVGYSVLGKYYPYAKKAVDKVSKMKSDSAKKDSEAKANGQMTKAEKKQAKKAAKKAKKEAKKKWLERDEGTTFWYTKENPAFLIENAKASGVGFFAQASEITTDQDVRGKPMTIKGNFNLKGVTHSANVLVDARSYSKEPLIQLSYAGKNFKTSFDGTTIAQNSGIPSISGTANIDFSGKFDSGLFNGSGNVSMNPVSLTSDGFSSEVATKYYNQALASIKNLDFGFNTSYTQDSGVNLNLIGNFSDIFAQSMQKIVSSLGSDAKNAAMAKLNGVIDSSNNEYLSKAKEFLGLENSINLQNANLTSIQSSLDSKKAEIEAEIKKRTEEAASSAITNALGNSSAGQAASDALKNLPSIPKKTW